MLHKFRYFAYSFHNSDFMLVLWIQNLFSLCFPVKFGNLSCYFKGYSNYFLFLWGWHGILKYVKFSLLICTFSIPCEELHCAQCWIPEGIGKMLWNWICSCGCSLVPLVILNWTACQWLLKFSVCSLDVQFSCMTVSSFQPFSLFLVPKGVAAGMWKGTYYYLS